MKLEIDDFNSIFIFKYREIYHTLKNEKRNISNTNEYLLNFIEEFEVQFNSDKTIVIYSENGEDELNICDVILYDSKNKSFIIENDDLYFKLKEVYKNLKKLKEV